MSIGAQHRRNTILGTQGDTAVQHYDYIEDQAQQGVGFSPEHMQFLAVVLGCNKNNSTSVPVRAASLRWKRTLG